MTDSEQSREGAVSQLGFRLGVLGIALTVVVVGLAAVITGLRTLPRMRDQHSIKPFERSMPAMPENVVPYSGGEPLILAEDIKKGTEPFFLREEGSVPFFAERPDAAEIGAVYYGYYCTMCHGPDGRGATPVGAGYIPKPSDLTAAELQARSDADLYTAMLEGSGHDDVIRATVPPERRWYIVTFLRALGAGTGGAE